MLDMLVQSRRDKQVAKRLLQKLLKKQGRPPRVQVIDKLASYPATKQELMPGESSIAGTKVGTTEPKTLTSRHDGANGR